MQQTDARADAHRRPHASVHGHAGVISAEAVAPGARARSASASILLCWGYHRAGWIEPFESLKDAFRFTYLYYVNRSEEQRRLTDQPTIYWGDFRDADAILDAVRPAKIVFMSLTSGYTIALNAAAQRRGIPTYVLQHGVFSSYAEYRAAEALSSRQSAPPGAHVAARVARPSSLAFVRRSLTVRDLLALPQLVLFFVLLRWRGHTLACRVARFPQRMPSFYICFTVRNATLHRELDHPSPDRMHVIGIPEYDKFFAAREAAGVTPGDEPAGARYYLLIDQPLAENGWGLRFTTRDVMVAFYHRLAEFCVRDGARLKVKLHPETYGSDWLPDEPDIEWVEDADVVALIRGSAGCFGMASSLVLPAIVLGRVCLFDAYPSSLLDDLRARGIVPVLPFPDFDPGAVHFAAPAADSEAMSAFVDAYFGRADGRATARLRGILEG